MQFRNGIMALQGDQGRGENETQDMYLPYKKNGHGEASEVSGSCVDPYLGNPAP